MPALCHATLLQLHMWRFINGMPLLLPTLDRAVTYISATLNPISPTRGLAAGEAIQGKRQRKETCHNKLQ